MRTVSYIFFFLPLCLSAQDITGVWKGYLKTPGSHLAYELTISEEDKKITGYSLIVYINEGVENIGIKTAKIKRRKKEILVEDGELVYDNFTMPPQKTKLFGSLLLEKKDTLMILHGSFSTRSLDFRDTRTYSGEIYLQKENNYTLSKIIPKLNELNLLSSLSFLNTNIKKDITVNKPARDSLVVKPPLPKIPITTKTEIATRKTEKILDIVFNSDSLQLSIVDNGTVDGDTVSLVLDGKVIVEKLGLTSQPFRMTIPVNVPQGDSLKLVMYAENMGSIPPNTGLLVIQDGINRHEIRFESDLQKSSAVILRIKRR